MAKIKVRITASQRVEYDQIVLMEEAEFLRQTEVGDMAIDQDAAGEYIDTRTVVEADGWEDVELFRFRPPLPAEQEVKEVPTDGQH